jgi:hypothetical protein
MRWCPRVIYRENPNLAPAAISESAPGIVAAIEHRELQCPEGPRGPGARRDARCCAHRAVLGDSLPRI